MKSLILKDFYSIRHTAKTIPLLLLFMGGMFIPTSGPVSFVAVCAIMCSMLVVTTFSLDDSVKWNRYALIMPVTRKDIVTGKYIVHLLFSLAGIVTGIAVAVVYELIIRKPLLGETFFCGLVSLMIAVVFGSIVIPLLFKYGAEKARLLMILCFAVPTVIVYGLYKLLGNVPALKTFSWESLLWFSPLLALMVLFLSIHISVRIFSKKELS